MFLFRLGSGRSLICNDCCSVPESCLTLCDPTNCSTPGFPVLHWLLEFARGHSVGVVPQKYTIGADARKLRLAETVAGTKMTVTYSGVLMSIFNFMSRLVMGSCPKD